MKLLVLVADKEGVYCAVGNKYLYVSLILKSGLRSVGYSEVFTEEARVSFVVALG